jgi:hypothetical protein
MVMVFFNFYTNHFTKGGTVNIAFIRTALHRFVKVLKKK